MLLMKVEFTVYGVSIVIIVYQHVISWNNDRVGGIIF